MLLEDEIMPGIPTLWMKLLAVKWVEKQSKSKLFYLFHILGGGELIGYMCGENTS